MPGKSVKHQAYSELPYVVKESTRSHLGLLGTTVEKVLPLLVQKYKYWFALQVQIVLVKQIKSQSTDADAPLPKRCYRSLLKRSTC